jgi:hypothetical protein
LIEVELGDGMKPIYNIFGGAVWAVLGGGIAAPAYAHIGHLGELAGHDHWIALGALGAAGAIALIAGLKGKKKDSEAEEADAEDDATHDEELQEA